MLHRARCMEVVVHTPDVVGARMAGPGIRAWRLASELSRHFETTLIAKRPEDGQMDSELPAAKRAGLRIVERGTAEASEALRQGSVLVGQPARGFRPRGRRQRIVYDMFDPTVLELRELYGAAPSLRQRIHLGAEWWRLTEALLRADLLVSAARSQRRFYESLQAGEAPWIDVPFGIDPAETAACEKPRHQTVLWGGGLWEWLDPASAVDAVVKLNASGVQANLLFLGRSRPNRHLIDRRREDRFDELLAKGGRFVAANREWVPYRERLDWLRASRIAIMLHRKTPEAEFSIRTRLFDAIATATPVLASAGGYAAALVEREGLGVVVPPEDAEAIRAGMLRLLKDDEFWLSCVQNLKRVQPAFYWDVVTRPLVDSIRTWLK